MSLHKCKLGELITQRREKNNDDSLPISGVSKDGLIPPKQQEADTSLYNMFYRGDFIFNPARMELNSIAYNDKYDKAICSSLYEVFYVHRTDLILPEFLALIVKQDWFTRYCEFLGQGSAREYCRFANISEIEIEFPDIDVQKKTVHCYNVIKRRIELKQQINDNLEATAQAYFDKLFIDGFECTTNLDKIANINPTRNLAKNQIARCFDMSSLPLKGCIPVGGEYKPYNGGMRFINGDTILARITPCLENGKAAYINILDESEVAFGSTEYIVLSPKENVPSSFFYFLARNSTFISYAVAHMNGSSGRQRVSGSDIANYLIKEPSKDELQMFDKYASKVLYEMKVSALEIEKLKELQENITATISGR